MVITDKNMLQKESGDRYTPFCHSVLCSIPRTVSVTSGKGGVGKTSIVTNLATAAALRGQKVLIIDCDLGLSNVDVQLGVNPPYNLLHALSGQKTLSEVMVTAPNGVYLLPAPFGVEEITHLTPEQKLNLMALLEGLDQDFDLILLDTGAGIHSNVMFFNMLANHIVVILTPEPCSLTDAYALIKVMNLRYGATRFHLLVNNVKSSAEGVGYYRRFLGVIQTFLNVSVDYFGTVTSDSMFVKSNLVCRPLVDLYPRSAAAKSFKALAERIEALPWSDRKGRPMLLSEETQATHPMDLDAGELS